MPLNVGDTDLLIQYALLVAGEEDDYPDRQLGPIHLIKYVYLADLAFAAANHGKTFTGADWKFYKFGPWSAAVYERIEPALFAIRANKHSFPSDFEDRENWVRWELRDERLLEDSERRLPPRIASRLKRDVHKFGKDTPGLLHYVYGTKPMLSAAPNEPLDLSLVVEPIHPEAPQSPKMKFDDLSKRKKKQFSEQMATLRERHRAKQKDKPRLVSPVENPRYDEVYDTGIAWLDELAGEQIQLGEKTVEFSDEVWKSNTRNGKDVS